MYTLYLAGYPKALETINEQRNNKRFQAFLAEKRKACGLDLMSYLIVRLPLVFCRSLVSFSSLRMFPAAQMPVQRIPRYELLLREMIRYTKKDHPVRALACSASGSVRAGSQSLAEQEHAKLAEAFEKIQSIASRVNEDQRQVENMSKLLEIQNRISGDFGTLMQPHRRLVRELLSAAAI